jgi:vitamin B12 transporter
MSVRVWVSYLFFLSLLVPAVCIPSEGDKRSDTEETRREVYSQSKEAVEDLLMFWEEKDLFVQSATRNEKPISQVAENMTVITAKDIEDMNAHTIAEVLNRVTGFLVSFLGQDFGSLYGALSIDGSADRHVLVLLDGMQWNWPSDNHALTGLIPVGIIERIEIIKGPASSAWGSSLGGVVNIITKNTGDTKVPAGTLSASYGERETQDYSAGISGKAGPVGYYLFAGHQSSDGLRFNREFNNDDLFAKMSMPVSKDVTLVFSAGYSDLDIKPLISQDLNFMSKVIARAFFATGSVDAVLTRELNLKLSLYTNKQKGVVHEGLIEPDTILSNRIYENKTTGGSAKLIWTHGIHTAVLGTDIIHSSLEQNLVDLDSEPEVDKWAVFANDSITIGKLTITPGIRYDHNSISGSFVSPSLGITYKLGEHSVARASVARGFSYPSLSDTTIGDGAFLDPNPDLKSEKVWSYQAGLESNITDYILAKATVFYHDMSDSMIKEFFASDGPPGCVAGVDCNDLIVNNGNVKRKGFELQLETAPFYNVSFEGGFAYVNTDPLPEAVHTWKYAYNLAVKYDDRKSFMAQLWGTYKWLINRPDSNGKYNDFIWDLNLQKKIYSTERTRTELFLTAHNIFNASQYDDVLIQNPRRWVEAGLRFKF